MGDPRLLVVSTPVLEFNSAGLLSLIADMQDTMRAASGAGLAAPQIGVPLRLVIFGGGRSLRYPEAEPVPQTILINPQLKPQRGGMEEDWEGCLSVPGMRGMVPRHRRLRYFGFDETGAPIDVSAEGFHARVVQHEVDHLDGVLYPTRIRDLRQFGFVEELFPGQPVHDE